VNFILIGLQKIIALKILFLCLDVKLKKNRLEFLNGFLKVVFSMKIGVDILFFLLTELCIVKIHEKLKESALL